MRTGPIVLPLDNEHTAYDDVASALSAAELEAVRGQAQVVYLPIRVVKLRQLPVTVERTEFDQE